MPTFVEADLAERLLGRILPAPIRGSGAVLIAVNCVPLYGVLFWGWPVFYVMALYWAENVIAGFYTLLRMIVANPVAGVPLGAFFCFHYGMFCTVHGVFVNVMFNKAHGNAPIDDWALPHTILGTPTLFYAALLMVLSHGWSFIGNFVMREDREEDVRTIMMRPYGRMVLLHVTILVGGLLATTMGTPVAALVFLILLKTAIDLGMHRRANVPAKKGAAPTAPAPAAPPPPHPREGPPPAFEIHPEQDASLHPRDQPPQG